MDQNYRMSAFKGAVYFPSRAYNAYQTYEYFDADEIDRDFSYAQKAGISALRIFTSFEQYEKGPGSFFDKFDALLSAAERHSVSVMPILFENCGRDFTIEAAMDRDPDTAVCVKSPSLATIQHPDRWEPWRAVVEALKRPYGGDSGGGAKEVKEEPE